MSRDARSLLELRFDRGRFEIDLCLEWNVETLVLFGASGAGKTTLMRVLLGLEPEARGRVRLAGEWLEDASAGLRLPVHRRRLGWVPQSPTLFPDRTVDANIRFGVARDADEAWLQRTLDVLELSSLLGRSVKGLSGGERQRVAIARAIAIRPRALLLDEPMASLDVGLRSRVLPYLLRIRDELELPLVYITHDPDEAILLGDEIAVLDHGRLIAQGPPRETLWSQAVDSLTTRLEVENVFEVEGCGAGEHARRVRTTQGLDLETPWPASADDRWTIGLRAEDILLSLDRPSRISARNVIRGRVARIDVQPDERRVHVDAGAERLIARLTESAVEELELEPGSDVYLIIKSQALRRIR